MTKLNKKGTSLVELIAVIVIMGIIAAIAIPTTIGVINRQKKNAAEKSAETIVNALKARASEEYAAGGYIVVIGVNNKMKVAQNDVEATAKTDAAAITDANAEALGVDNADFTGSVTVVFDATAGTYTYTVADFKVDGYTVAISAAGKVSVSN